MNCSSFQQEDIKSSEIERKLEKYLPYLIYYKDVYQSSLDGVTEMKAYLEDIFKKHVRFIPNAHLEAVRKTGLIFWKKTTAEERYERFKPLIIS